MSTINFDEDSAKALLFVAKGAGKSDHSSVLFFDVFDSGEATISTTFTSTRRSMNISVEEPEERTYAVRAQAITSVAQKVDEDQSMSITFRDNKVHISCGATSATLSDLYPHVIDERKDISNSTVTTVDAPLAITSIVRAAEAVSGRDTVILSDDGQGMTIGSGSDDLYTQEIIPSTLLGGTDKYRVQVDSSELKKVKDLLKIEAIDDLRISLGKGFITLSLPISYEETSLKSISYTTPTKVSTVMPKDTPCDGDISPVLVIDKKLLDSALKSIRGVVGSTAVVTLDGSQDNRVVVKVSDDESNGKTVIVDAIIDNKAILSASMSTIFNALRAVGSGLVNIGTVAYHDSEWIALSPEFEEDAESETDNSDIIVAVKQSDTVE